MDPLMTGKKRVSNGILMFPRTKQQQMNGGYIFICYLLQHFQLTTISFSIFLVFYFVSIFNSFQDAFLIHLWMRGEEENGGENGELGHFGGSFIHWPSRTGEELINHHSRVVVDKF